jgi:hypothetical protein
MKIGKLVETLQELFFEDKMGEKKKKKLAEELEEKIKENKKKMKKAESEKEKDEFKERIFILNKLLDRLEIPKEKSKKPTEE